MKCSRCATELPETAMTCPGCGEPRNADPLTSFSYRPPGTPPWPTSVPQNLQQLVSAAPVATNGFAPTAPHIQKQRAGKARNSAASVLSSIAVLVIAPLIGAAIVFGLLYNQGYFAGHLNASSSQAAKPAPAASNAQPTPATQASGNTQQGATSVPAPASFKTAQDKNVNVTLRYPSDWTLKQPGQSGNSSIITIEQASIGIDIKVEHFTTTFSNSISNTQQLNQAYIQSLAQALNIQNIQTVQPGNNTPSIGGDKWLQSDAVFTDSQGIKQHFIVISDQHSKSYYGINIIVPDSLYKDASAKYFTPIFQSLKFLS